MSYDSMRDQFDEVRKQYRSLMRDGRFRDAVRRAEALHEELQAAGDPEADNLAETVQNDIVDMQSQATSQRDEALAWLDHAFALDAQAFDAEEANRQIVRLRNADVGDAYGRDIDAYEQRINDLLMGEAREARIQQAIDECKQLWVEAEAVEADVDMRASPEFLLDEYYDRVLKTARAAATVDGDPRLKLLVQDANDRREMKALAAQVMTSAGEGHQYTKALNDLDQLADDAPIPNYAFLTDEDGKTDSRFRENISKDAARKLIKEYAQVWADGKINEYMRTARESVDAQAPLSALAELERRVEVLQFMSDERREDFTRLERDIREAQGKWEQAEARAQDAQGLLDDDPLAAWRVLEEAREIYTSVPQIEDVHKAVVVALRRKLEEFYQQAQDARRDMRFDEVTAIVDQVQREYGRIAAPEVSTLVDRIDAESRDAEREQRDLEEARRLLSRVQRALAEGNVSAAERDLEQLEQLPREIQRVLEGLDDVRSEILQRSEADYIYERLRNLVYEDQIVQVRRGMQDAQRLARELPDDPRIAQLAHDLELHRDWLEARRAESVGELDRTLEHLEPLRAAPEHPDHQRAQTLYSEVRQKKSDSDRDNEILDDFEQSLNDATFDELVATYRDLLSLNLNVRELSTRRTQLVTRVQGMLRTQVDDDLSEWDRQDEIDYMQVNNLLEVLRGDLQITHRYDFWHAKLQARLKAAEAR
ncbi:MAG: hypothetical protein K8S97_17150, partial [Anaerolineae bacterium]|nr:hypothetical protein [Anaerolineae bacterium]